MIFYTTTIPQQPAATPAGRGHSSTPAQKPILRAASRWCPFLWKPPAGGEGSVALIEAQSLSACWCWWLF